MSLKNKPGLFSALTVCTVAGSLSESMRIVNSALFGVVVATASYSLLCFSLPLSDPQPIFLKRLVMSSASVLLEIVFTLW